MKIKILVLLFLIHFALSLCGFLALSGWALSSADADISGTLPRVGWLESIVHFGLLQPVAHWVLSMELVAWWTWAGLMALTGLFAVNSGVVVAVVALVRHFCRATASD